MRAKIVMFTEVVFCLVFFKCSIFKWFICLWSFIKLSKESDWRSFCRVFFYIFPVKWDLFFLLNSHVVGLKYSQSTVFLSAQSFFLFKKIYWTLNSENHAYFSNPYFPKKLKFHKHFSPTEYCSTELSILSLNLLVNIFFLPNN